jgi:hypothetical protein
MYTLTWRNKYLTSNAQNIDGMIAKLEAALAELRQMRDAGVTLGPSGPTEDDYAVLVTDDPLVAEKFGFDHLEEDEFEEEDHAEEPFEDPGGDVIAGFEFPFKGQDEESSDVVTRLRQLLDIATRLRKAKWPMQFTLTGLRFEPPGSQDDDRQFDEQAEELTKRLADMGIEEKFTLFPSRTADELLEANRELDDGVWYGKRFGSMEDFDWGLLNGKLSTVRWALGCRWDFLDT